MPLPTPSSVTRPRLSQWCRSLIVLASLALALAAIPAQAQDGTQPAWSDFLYLPGIRRAATPYRCPTTSPAHYDALPYEGNPTGRPAELHADLNLVWRNYDPAAAPPVLVWYGGGTDALAPQLSGLFAGGRMPVFASAYQVFDWVWACGTNGCRGPLLGDWPTTLLGLANVRGEAVRPPSRGAALWSGGYVALVLYASDSRITLKYTREDNVVSGYTVHLENICVDPALLQLYRSLNAAGRPRLPALRNGEALGTATGDPLLVAVRDNGRFMDPRSAKDWWKVAQTSGLPQIVQLDTEHALHAGRSQP